MKTSRKLLPLLLAALAAMPLRAEKRALIVAIGTYDAREIPVLDGPPNDAAAMEDLLRNKLGFTDVVNLRREQTTRAGILAALNDLKARTRRGDYVVFYYSGHGTSYGDPAARTWGLDPNTGALLPRDIQIGNASRVNAQLIIGKRDLRPVFTEIDKLATLFAIFDTCYSADAAKSAAKKPASRFVPLSALVTTRAAGGAASKGSNDMDADDPAAVIEHQDRSPFPYTQVISLAAAGKFQPAGDISNSDVRFDPSLTYDHKAHGVMSEALLRGMTTGAADKNHDGSITHDELYNYLQEKAVSWSHKPVMQAAPGADSLLSSPAFDARTTVVRPAPSGTTHNTVVVKVEGAPPALAARIGQLPRIALAAPSAAAFDLLVQRTAQGYDLFDSSKVAIANDSLSETDLLARIAAQPQVQDLIDLSYPQQFNVSLRMKPDDQSVFFDRQAIGFSARTDRAAYLLLLNVDVTGVVTVVYPFHSAAAAFPAGEYRDLGDPDEVVKPFGIEYMKLFAFASKPADFDRWIAPPGQDYRTVQPGSPEFERLMKMLRSANGAAETRLRVVTAPLPNH